jgi:transcriptional regulator with XRE-family HTH domain
MSATPCRFIREEIFKIKTQREFAELLECSQPKISRYENGDEIPSSTQKLIRSIAKKRGIAWNDVWFFEVPHKQTQTNNKRPEATHAST